MRGRLVALLTVGALVAAGVVGWSTFHDRVIAPILGVHEECSATVAGRTVTLEPEQARNAALIAAIATRRQMPARAVTIALAAAFQESKLYNLRFGDRDSLGLFQQRPSQGWGTRAEVLDPAHATNAFYDALDRVEDYPSLEVTVAAQEVQRSGFPSAYAAHEADARVLASALSGESAHAFSCVVDGEPAAAADALLADGLTRRADRVRADLETAFGDLTLGGYAPGGVATGHMVGSAHYEGRALDAFVRPITEGNQVTGWAIAQYAVAQASRLGIATVIFDGRIWTATRSEEGWRAYSPPAGAAGDRAILEHRDHVHVDVFG